MDLGTGVCTLCQNKDKLFSDIKNNLNETFGTHTKDKLPEDYNPVACAICFKKILISLELKQLHDNKCGSGTNKCFFCESSSEVLLNLGENPANCNLKLTSFITCCLSSWDYQSCAICLNCLYKLTVWDEMHIAFLELSRKLQIDNDTLNVSKIKIPRKKQNIHNGSIKKKRKWVTYLKNKLRYFKSVEALVKANKIQINSLKFPNSRRNNKLLREIPFVEIFVNSQISANGVQSQEQETIVLSSDSASEFINEKRRSRGRPRKNKISPQIEMPKKKTPFKLKFSSTFYRNLKLKKRRYETCNICGKMFTVFCEYLVHLLSHDQTKLPIVNIIRYDLSNIIHNVEHTNKKNEESVGIDVQSLITKWVHNSNDEIPTSSGPSVSAENLNINNNSIEPENTESTEVQKGDTQTNDGNVDIADEDTTQNSDTELTSEDIPNMEPKVVDDADTNKELFQEEQSSCEVVETDNISINSNEGLNTSEVLDQESCKILGSEEEILAEEETATEKEILAEEEILVEEEDIPTEEDEILGEIIEQNICNSPKEHETPEKMIEKIFDDISDNGNTEHKNQIEDSECSRENHENNIIISSSDEELTMCVSDETSDNNTEEISKENTKHMDTVDNLPPSNDTSNIVNTMDVAKVCNSLIDILGEGIEENERCNEAEESSPSATDTDEILPSPYSTLKRASKDELAGTPVKKKVRFSDQKEIVTPDCSVVYEKLSEFDEIVDGTGTENDQTVNSKGEEGQSLS